MGKQFITSAAKSQIENREIFGVDMGGNLWATAIRHCGTGKTGYYGLKDKVNTKRKNEFIPKKMSFLWNRINRKEKT